MRIFQRMKKVNPPSKNYVFMDLELRYWFAIKGQNNCFCLDCRNLPSTVSIETVEQMRKMYMKTRAATSKKPEEAKAYFEISENDLESAFYLLFSLLRKVELDMEIANALQSR